MTGRREIQRRLDELEAENGDDAPDVIIRDEVVATPWSNTDGDGRKVPASEVTRLRWDSAGGEWVKESLGDAWREALGKDVDGRGDSP